MRLIYATGIVATCVGAAMTFIDIGLEEPSAWPMLLLIGGLCVAAFGRIGSSLTS